MVSWTCVLKRTERIIHPSMAASLLYIKDMNKRLLGLSCSSAASASVVTGRAIDRRSPHPRDPHRSMSKPPKPKPTSTSSKDSFFSSNKQQHYGSNKKKSSTSTSRPSSSSSEKKRLVSPANSSRFLLNSSRMQSDDVNYVAELALPPPPPFIDIFPGEEAPTVQSSASSPSEIAAVVGTSSGTRDRDDEKAVIRRSFSTRTQDLQVVVLRVSLHCKGCAGKVKKHISKMEGVRSLDIDIAAKKVTVVGDVTPLGVLNTISKLKPAQLWPTPPRASASF